jgi:hypothetical protein
MLALANIAHFQPQESRVTRIFSRSHNSVPPWFAHPAACSEMNLPGALFVKLSNLIIFISAQRINFFLS